MLRGLLPKQSTRLWSAQVNNWQQHFIQVGENGSDNYRNAMSNSVNEIVKVFESADKPYSAMDATTLQRAIYDLRLDQGSVSPLSQVISETAELVARNAIIVQHPDCIAHLHTPPLIAGITAENFIAAQNQSMDSWDQSASATYVEQYITDWLCKQFGFDEHSDGVFTSGGTQSNIMALLMARDWVADVMSGHNIQKEGLPEYAPKLRILCSTKSHFTVKKAASIMGLGEKAVVCVPTHQDGTLILTALEETLTQLKQAELIPFVVVGTAGTTDHGAIDDLTAISNIAEQHKIWFHVDAAYGGAVILSQSKERLAGIELADSVTVDFHKLWFQPVSCSAVMLKNKTNFKYLLHHADYLNRESDDLPNLVDKTISTTRRFDALKVLMTLRAVGSETLGQMVDHLLAQTQQVATMVTQHNEFELLAQPPLSTVLFRYIGENTGANVDEFNRQLRVQLLKAGIAVLGETTVDGQAALKLTILNPCLTLNNFNELFEKIVKFAKALK